METIDVNVRFDSNIDVTVNIEEVIDAINEAPMTRRWNYVAQIINGVETDLKDTTDEQKAIIKRYLTNKLASF